MSEFIAGYYLGRAAVGHGWRTHVIAITKRSREDGKPVVGSRWGLCRGFQSTAGGMHPRLSPTAADAVAGADEGYQAKTLCPRCVERSATAKPANTH